MTGKFPFAQMPTCEKKIAIGKNLRKNLGGNVQYMNSDELINIPQTSSLAREWRSGNWDERPTWLVDLIRIKGPDW